MLIKVLTSDKNTEDYYKINKKIQAWESIFRLTVAFLMLCLNYHIFASEKYEKKQVS